MILKYSDILQYYWLFKQKNQFIVDWQQVFYNPYLASAVKTYGEIKNDNYGDGDRDNDINKDKNDDDGAASGSGSDGQIFDLIVTHCPRFGHALVLWSSIGRQRWRRCIRSIIYIYALEYI